MDGNRRWARKNNLPRIFGHRQGVKALRKIIRRSYEKGIKYITLYSFSTENWKRSLEEVSELMHLFRWYMHRELDELHKNNAQIRFIGSREGLESDILELIDLALTRTRNNTGIVLNVAFNYGGRQELVQAMRRIAEDVQAGKRTVETIDESVIADYLYTADIPNPDLVIRTSGEKRLSNFLIWQTAYSEFYFADTLWPDFDEDEFEQALAEYAQRERRYGGGGDTKTDRKPEDDAPQAVEK